MFGLIHMIPQQVLNAALLGLVLGLIAVRSRSIVPGMAFHFAFNGLELSRNRFGVEIPTGGAWGWFFRVDGGLQYQPALLALAAPVAIVLIGLLLRRPRDDDALMPTLTTEEFALTYLAPGRPRPRADG
jgi:sodium transport system permease protein